MTKKHFEFAAKMIREYQGHPGNAQLLRDAFVVVFREFNPRFDEARFRAAAGESESGPDAPDPGEFVGTCPACRESVFSNEPDGPVWTCPADLADTNPFHEAPLHDWTEADRERMGYFGNCLEDVDFSDAPGHHGRCYERLPLHSACYARGNY